MKERMNMMFRMSKTKSRILAGFMAFVLVMSNIAANVQSVYAASGRFGLQDGQWTWIEDEKEETETVNPETEQDSEEKAYDFWVDISPLIKETGEGSAWDGSWEEYEYDASGLTLGQALLLSEKYKEQYGELDIDLPGVWEGSNDEVIEVRPDGTAYVKSDGYVEVRFTYNGEVSLKDEAAEEPEYTTGEAVEETAETAVENTLADETESAGETTEAEETLPVHETESESTSEREMSLASDNNASPEEVETKNEFEVETTESEPEIVESETETTESEPEIAESETETVENETEPAEEEVNSLLEAGDVLTWTVRVGMASSGISLMAVGIGTFYEVSYPRSEDTTTRRSNWGRKTGNLLGGYTLRTNTNMFTAHALGDWDGKVAYCIEPGVSLNATVNQNKQDPETYFKTLDNGRLKGSEIMALLGLILENGYKGNISTGWGLQNGYGDGKLQKLIATQLLVWETVVGERYSDFTKYNAGNESKSNILDLELQTNHPLYNSIMSNYTAIENAVKNELKIPSFAKRTEAEARNDTKMLQWQNGEASLELTDENGVLSKWSCQSQAGLTVTQSGNTLKLKATDVKALYSGVLLTIQKTVHLTNGVLIYGSKDDGKQDLMTYTDGTDTEVVKSYVYVKLDQPAPVTYAPKVEKRVTSIIPKTNPAPTRSYTFKIEAVDGAPLPTSSEKSINGPGIVQFDEITFEKPGTYHYTIREIGISNNSDNSFTMDNRSVSLTVVVEQDPADPTKLRATASYSGGDKIGADENGLENKFTVKPITYKPEVTKKITGPVTVNKDFTFKLEKDSFDPAGGVVMPTQTEVVVTGAQKGTFDEIKFTRPGTYSFKITEVDGKLPGYSYDTESKKLTVVVGYDKNTGTLTKKVTYEGGKNEATVTNNYHITETVKRAPKVKKILEGYDAPETAFDFSLEQVSGPEGGTDPNETSQTVQIEDLGTYKNDNSSEKTIAFSDIEFKLAGEYVFKITEKKKDKPGFTYDESEITWTVKVKDVDSKLQIESAEYNPSDETNPEYAVFTNKYSVKEAYYAPVVRKVITGDERTSGEKTFRFELAPKGGVETIENGFEMAGNANPMTAEVLGEGTAYFDDITFKREGTYTFTVSEVKGNDAGYTYDEEVYTLTVVVEAQNIMGQRLLVVSKAVYSKGDETVDTPVFTNKYEVKPTDYAPKAKKAVIAENGKSPKLEEQEFTFILSGEPQDGAELPAVRKVTVAGENKDFFESIHFTKAGTYGFKLTEKAGDIPGYTYDDREWMVTVVVEDMDSQLTVTHVTYTQEGGTEPAEIATFTNTYEVEPTDYEPEVAKQFTGNSDPRPQDYVKTFTFTLAGEQQDGAALPESRTVSVTSSNVYGANKGTFDAIHFTKAGTYTFTITEDALPADAKGYGHDDSVWTLTVVVEDKDSKLEVTSHTYTKDGFVIPSVVHAAFTNSYHVQPTTYQPKATKQVIGEVIPDRKYFQFTLEAAESNPEGMKWDEHVKNGVDSIGVYGLPDYQISQGNFYPVTFEKAGTYMFNILEEDTNEAGYTYDSRLWRLTVEVVDIDGQLEVKSAVYDVTGADGQTVFYSDVEDFNIVGGGATARFVNEYKPAPTHYAPEVMKLIYGNAMPPEDRTYTFVLEHGFWYPNGVLTDAGAVMPEDPTATVVGVGRGKFNAIEFTKAGTYNFTVREKDEGGVNGYLYDDTTWNVEVTVIDYNGQLAVTNVAYTKQAGTKTENVGPENSGEPQKDTGHVLFASFYNEYNVIPTETQLHVTKYVTGSVRPDNNVATFNFRLALIDATTRNGATLPEKQTVTITGSGDPGLLGTADFDPIKFTQAGTYIFEIDEMTGFETDTQTMPGYTYDSSTWKVSVEVEDHNGTLVVTKKEYNHLVNGERVDSSDVPAEEGAMFVNDYDVESTKYAPKVNKEFARSAAARPTEETFTFTMEPAADYGENITFSDAATAKEVTVTGAGIAAFDDITFNEAGTYEFIISETDSGKPGYTYDPVKWKLTVEIVDTGNQLLVNTTSYAQIDGPESAGGMATFTNDYQAEEGGYVPQVEKKLIGADRPTEKEFTFSIVENGYTPPAYALALESGAVMPEKTEVTVTGEGTASFDEIRFTNAGVYSFLITENKGTDNGYTYDEAVWNLTVTVEDVAGQLTATKAVYESNGTEADKATFTNDYEVTATEYAPGVKKTVLGNPLEEEQFNFTMESGEGNETDGFEFAEGDIGRHVTVNGAGTGNFGGITFKKAGTYTFKIKETSSNSPFWVDDDRTWTLTVVVEDEDSKLVVKSHTYVRDGEDSVTSDTEAEFENEYHGPGDLSISKTVSGNRGEMTRAFNFTVTFTNLKGEPLAGTYEYVGSSTVEGVEAPADGTLSGGVLNITLAHGQKITIKGIPADTKYTVTETEADTEEYLTSVEVNGDRLTDDEAAGEVVRDTETVVEYLNYRNRTPGRPNDNDNPGGGPGDNPGPEFELITDEPTPLASFENIEDEDVPLAFMAPMTGDNKPVGAAALFGLLALGMMGAFGILGFKKDEEDV